MAGLLNLFADDLSVDGWTSAVGDVAAVSALLLAVATTIALVRPNLAEHLPLGMTAGFMGYFLLAVAAQARSGSDAGLPLGVRRWMTTATGRRAVEHCRAA